MNEAKNGTPIEPKDGPIAWRDEQGNLHDERGVIPRFPPPRLDEKGRLIPIPAHELEAQAEAVVRTLRAIRAIPDDDPPGIEEEFMRGIDSRRPPGFKLFEGMY